MVTRARRLALALMVASPIACLPAAVKDRCNVDGDCNPGRVCVAGTCGPPGAGDSGVDATVDATTMEVAASDAPGSGADSGPGDATAVNAICERSCDAGCCSNGRCVAKTQATTASACGISSNAAVCGACVGPQSCKFGGHCIGGWPQVFPPSSGDPAWTTSPPWADAVLGAIWGSGAGNVYVLAQSSTSFPDEGVFHLETSTGWTVQPLPTQADLSFQYLGIWGSGPSDVYIVGGDQPSTVDGGVGGLVYHSTGDGAWSQESTGPVGLLVGVWGSSPGSVYAVGEGPSSNCVVLHSSGNGSWAAQPIGGVPDGGGITKELFAVWGSGPHDVYAVGGPTILHSTDGDTWKVEYNDTGSEYFQAVWGSSATDVYAVGSEVMHSTGAGDWTSFPVSTTFDGQAIWGSAANDVYITDFVNGIWHSTGAEDWTLVTSSLQDFNSPSAIWGSGSSNIYVSAANDIIYLGP